MYLLNHFIVYGVVEGMIVHVERKWRHLYAFCSGQNLQRGLEPY